MLRVALILLLLSLGCTEAGPERAVETTAVQEAPQALEAPEPTPEPAPEASPEPTVTPARVEYEKNPTDDPFLDRNGDGFQDVLLAKNRVHYDLDFDGKFDYTTSLKFTEYTSEGHREYIESGFDKAVYHNLTMAGLESLCANDREAAGWIEENFDKYYFYHDGYSFLAIFSDSEVNDIRIKSPKEKGEYDYRVIFNPDGSIRSIRKGTESVILSEYDYETGEHKGEKVYLPTKIETIDDLEAIKAQLDTYFA